VFADVKRLIGRKFGDLGTDADKLHIQWPFKVARGGDEKPMIHVEYRGKEKVFSAVDVYVMILELMKNLAEVYSGCVVDSASVSVPHCFTSAQRQATRNACSLAGFETVSLVNEPVCAALAYTLKTIGPSVGEKKVMVFDLGGGSLDVTLFTIEEGVIEAKATSGESQLGGEDFDLRLLHHFVQEIKQKYERDITSHPRVMRTLKKQAERVKVTLSTELDATVQIDSLLEDFSFYSSISRACFEEMNMDLFENCIRCVDECLQRAGLAKADVDEVVLVGGSSRIPKVQELLAEFFNNRSKLNTSINPDEAVVCGAAARAGIARGCSAFTDYLVVDVIPMSLGLETAGGAIHVMHPRNSSIPRSSEQLFTTVHDDQPGIFIQVYEGEDSHTCNNMLIATVELPGIPPAPHGVPQILVRFDVDAYGILTVSAKDKTTGEKVEVCMVSY
jgi:heat shock protein 1/8